MFYSHELLVSILNTVSENIVVIDRAGYIQYVNLSWIKFAQENDYSVVEDWESINYLTVCDKASDMGDEYGSQAAKGIRSVINNEQELFYLEYPCHSPDKQRWFMMTVAPLELKGEKLYLLSHQNITKRKLAEEKVLELSRLDGLTGISNRRYFGQFLSSEWKRCVRLHMPLSLAMIDIDNFKLMNDTYGHIAGDKCLKQIAKVIKKHTQRAGDICARYGGEEFIIVLGNTTFKEAKAIMYKLVEEVRELNIRNEHSPVMPIVTVSIGLAVIYPDKKMHEKELIEFADSLLYEAKEKGKNRVVSHCYKDDLRRE